MVSISIRTNKDLNEMITRLLGSELAPSLSESTAGSGTDRMEDFDVNRDVHNAELSDVSSQASGATYTAENHHDRDGNLISHHINIVDGMSSDQSSIGVAVERHAKSQPSVAMHSAVRNFRCTIDVTSIRSLAIGPALARIYVRYSYPFLGSAAPVFTQPLEVSKNSEKRFENSFCSFEFASTLQITEKQFKEVPLVLDVFMTDKYTTDELIGTCSIDLAELFRTVPALSEDGRPVFAIDSYYTVRSADTDTYKKVAELRISNTFADIGASDLSLHEQQTSAQPPIAAVENSKDREQHFAAAAHQFDAVNKIPAEAINIKSGSDLPFLPESQAARAEIDAWKAVEMGSFKQELRKKEAELLQLLASEWKSRETERSSQLTHRISEYDRLENELKDAITGISQREDSLRRKEVLVEDLRIKLQREYDQKIDEARDASRRLQTDVEHQLELQSRKIHSLEELLDQSKRDKGLSDSRYRKLEQEYLDFRQQAANAPAARLQDALTATKMELLETQRKLDVAEQARDKFKTQWSRALSAVASLRKRQHDTARESIVREQKELRHMRLQYLAKQEQNITDSERAELSQIREELVKLREASKVSQAGRTMSIPMSTKGAMNANTAGSGVSEEARRLIDERNKLLQSGLYSSTDRVIVELDARIQSARS